ncbi:MAG: hypothetical protein AAF434_07910 [Pseudomonadota bacterium]
MQNAINVDEFAQMTDTGTDHSLKLVRRSVGLSAAIFMQQLPSAMQLHAFSEFGSTRQIRLLYKRGSVSIKCVETPRSIDEDQPVLNVDIEFNRQTHCEMKAFITRFDDEFCN